jgi:hypothetical protein
MKRAASNRVRSAAAESSQPRDGIFIALQSRGVFALPADLRKRHRLDEPGAQVQVIEREDGVIELHPQIAVPVDQAWFWAPPWQAMEAEVDAHVAAGRTTRHESAEALFGHIDEARGSS